MPGRKNFGFIRNYLTAEIADDLDLFVYSASRMARCA